MEGQDVVDPVPFGRNIRVVPQAEIDDAGVRVEVLKCKLAEVTIVRDEDSVLAMRESENLAIRQTRRIVACDARRIVAERAKIRNEASIRTLVKEKPHPEPVALPARLRRWFTTAA